MVEVLQWTEKDLMIGIEIDTGESVNVTIKMIHLIHIIERTGSQGLHQGLMMEIGEALGGKIGRETRIWMRTTIGKWTGTWTGMWIELEDPWICMIEIWIMSGTEIMGDHWMNKNHSFMNAIFRLFRLYHPSHLFHLWIDIGMIDGEKKEIETMGMIEISVIGVS